MELSELHVTPRSKDRPGNLQILEYGFWGKKKIIIDGAGLCDHGTMKDDDWFISVVNGLNIGLRVYEVCYLSKMSNVRK